MALTLKISMLYPCYLQWLLERQLHILKIKGIQLITWKNTSYIKNQLKDIMEDTSTDSKAGEGFIALESSHNPQIYAKKISIEYALHCSSLQIFSSKHDMLIEDCVTEILKIETGKTRPTRPHTIKISCVFVCLRFGNDCIEYSTMCDIWSTWVWTMIVSHVKQILCINSNC